MASSNHSCYTKTEYAPKLKMLNLEQLWKTWDMHSTQDDIDFLKTHIAGKNTGQPNIAKKRFRNVSIITELNSQKDQLNKLGSMRFATETGQKLTDFYSDDELGEDIDPSTLSSVRLVLVGHCGAWHLRV